MNPFERWRRLHWHAFLRGQEAVANEVAGEEFVTAQDVTRRVAKAAAETIDLANELAADDDPDKKRLAALIKETALGAVQGQVEAGRSAGHDGRAIEAGTESPFSENSASSRPSLPGSTEPLPLTPPSSPPPRRGRGRPKREQPPPQQS